MYTYTLHMALGVAVVMFVCGLFFIIKGGDILVRSALLLNKTTGINQVIIGATFVSIATTLPEVFVSIFAVAAGNHGIAVGNAVGSMIVNIALVLAIPLAFMPNSVKRGEVLFKTLFLLLITGIVFLFALNLQLSWYEGIILLSAFIIFILFNAQENRNTQCRTETPLSKLYLRKTWLKIFAGFIFGQVMLVIGAFSLVEYGEQLAHFLGISETVVGFTVIAVGTSLPELTTAVTSVRCKSGGLAVGNVIGANVINCTLLLGICGIIGDIKGESLPVSRETVFIAIPVLFIMTVIAVLPLLIKGRASRWQGAILLMSYIAYITYLMVVQPL